MDHRSGTTLICTCENSYLGACALVTNALLFLASFELATVFSSHAERLSVGVVSESQVAAIFLE